MLEHTSAEIYKHYAGLICISTDSNMVSKGGFNLFNIARSQGEYILSLEQVVIDNNLLTQLTKYVPTPGKMVRLSDNPVPMNLIYRVNQESDVILPPIKELEEGKNITEWSIVSALPQMLIVGENIGPNATRLLMLSFRAKSIMVNQDMASLVNEPEKDFPVSSRMNAVDSIYGPLV